MNIKVKGGDKGGEKIRVSLGDKLFKVERDLADLKSIIRWAKDNKVGLGEIAEMLTTYNHFKEAVNGDFDDDFGAFEQFIHDMITNNITEADK